MDKLELKALAKINLGLDVLGRRDNGYHDVRMIMQTIWLYDEITLEKTDTPGIHLETNLSYLPSDRNNLAYRAAELLKDEFGISSGILIRLKKFIPVSAGLAGGSADAAAVLFGMNRMFRLGLGEQELKDRGVTLGADVPYCIMRGTVLAEGIGEKLTRLPAMPKCHVLIAKPGISVSTKTVYEKVDALEQTEHPDIDGIIAGLEAGDLHRTVSCMGNVLEGVTVSDHPVIRDIKEAMKAAGAVNAMMSGSGPTVFGIFDDRKAAKRAYAKIKDKRLAKQVYLTTIHNTRR